jgi:hypothetical protein
MSTQLVFQTPLPFVTKSPSTLVSAPVANNVGALPVAAFVYAI